MPHILNICTKHVVDEYSDVDLSAVGEAWVNSLDDISDKDTYVKAFRRDPIALGHDIVRLVRSSSLRRKGFASTIRTGNQMNWFTDDDGDTMQLPILELLRDVKSHWDSIYYMINHLRTLRQVSHLLLSLLLVDIL